MKLNRKTQPVVYRRVAIKTSILAQEARRAQLLQDIGILLFALAYNVGRRLECHSRVDQWLRLSVQLHLVTPIATIQPSAA